MSISAQTLFHFTNSAENLIDILTNEFQPRFCLENLKLILPKSLHAECGEMASPMVCFCDLPLSNIKEHLRFYGCYGIGLSKEWGVKNGLNPIIYLSSDSILCNHLTDIQKAGDLDVFKTFMELTSYTKPYEGKMYRNKKYVQKLFYDEREWRYVPDIIDAAVLDSRDYRLSKNEFVDDVKRANANAELKGKFTLSFEPDDIKYIIIKKEDEIYSMIGAIERIKRKYDEKSIKILSSRIISSEQIKQDF